jgi:hypothetical protein
LPACALQADDGDYRCIAELPVGWTLEVGDLLVDQDDRLVRVLELIPTPPGSMVAGLAKVAPRRLFRTDPCRDREVGNRRDSDNAARTSWQRVAQQPDGRHRR